MVGGFSKQAVFSNSRPGSTLGSVAIVAAVAAAPLPEVGHSAATVQPDTPTLESQQRAAAMVFAQFSGALSSNSSCGAADTGGPSSSAASPAASTNHSYVTDPSLSSAMAASNLAPPSSSNDGEPLNKAGSTQADLLFDAIEGGSSSSTPAEEPMSMGDCSPAVEELQQSAPSHLQQLRVSGAFVTAAGRRASDDPAALLAQLRARTDTTQIQCIMGSLERAVVGLATGDLITVLGKQQLALFRCLPKAEGGVPQRARCRLPRLLQSGLAGG